MLQDTMSQFDKEWDLSNILDCSVCGEECDRENDIICDSCKDIDYSK